MNAPAADEQDAQDMARLVEGQEAALNDLMDRHAQKLFHYLIRSLQNENDAADLTQETFVKVYHHRLKFDPSQKFTAWLYAIASNLVRDRYRWRSRHPQVSLDMENEQTESKLTDTLSADEPRPDEQMQTEERATGVRKAIADLPNELRQPLILNTYEGMSHAEIAKVLKCSVKAVETRIYRARQQLREALTELLQAT